MSDFENRLISYADAYHPRRGTINPDPYECEYEDGNLYFRFNTANKKYCKEYVQKLLDLNFKLNLDEFNLIIDGDEDWTEVVVKFNKSLFEGEADKALMGKVVFSGVVTVQKPFKTEYLDSDDFRVIKEVKPGIYEYRVLDVRGWKPRQLNIDGEWYDVGSSCEELEKLLAMQTESTVLTNKAEIKALPHGTVVRISGTDVPDIDGDYTVDQESLATGLVSKKDPKRILYFNAKFDHRIQDMLRQGVKFDANPDISETTTVANIAPTVDYMGHVNPPLLLPNMDVDGVYPDEKEYYKKAKVVKTGIKKPKKNEYNSDDPWSAPIGRIVAGEPVRSVIGEQLGFIVEEKDETLLVNYPKFQSIDSIKDIVDYPDTLYLKTSYPHKDYFGMRIEDPKITEYFGGVSRDNVPPYVAVQVLFDTTKDGWQDEVDKCDEYFYSFMGFDGFRERLAALEKNPFVKDISIKVYKR